MRLNNYLVVGALVLLMGAFVGVGPAESKEKELPGWGIQFFHLYQSLDDVVSEPVHCSPDGSFYEIADEGFHFRIGVTINVTKQVLNHVIPMDASCDATLYVDGEFIEFFLNSHNLIELDFEPGVHTIEFYSSCPDDSPMHWLGLSIGKCLWGTDKRIKFVRASARVPIPECVPTTGMGYILSGGINPDAGIFVDDYLRVYLNGDLISEFSQGGHCCPPGDPVHFTADSGDTLRIQAQDANNCYSLDPLYLQKQDGSCLMQLTEEIYGPDCGNEPPEQIFFDEIFELP
jgi:hypothetical protein